MSNADIFTFSLFLIAGWLRVPLWVALIGAAVCAVVAFLNVHVANGPWGLFQPSLSASLLTVGIMTAIYLALYGVSRAASVMRNQQL